MDAVEKRFADLCLVGLRMDDDATMEAMDLFRECRPGLEANLAALGCGQPEEIERHWSACALFCVTKLREEKTESENKESRIALTQILKATSITFAGFFREIPQFLPKTGQILSTSYGSDWEKRLGVKELQANFVHLRILSDHYKCAYEEFFLSSSINGDSCNTGSLSAGFLSEYHQFGWLLFLALRVHAFSRFRDLVTGINGLVAILAVLILHVPVQMRKFSISDSTPLVKKSDKGVDLLASLCNIHETTEAVLKAAIDQTNTLIMDILKKKPRPASECHAETLTNIDTDGLTYFEDLMKDGSLQSSVLILEKDYDDVVQTKGEIDERILVGNEDSLLGTGSLSGGAISIHRLKGTPMESPAKTVLSPMSPPRSPASPANGGHSGNIRIIATPVSTAMTTAKWLRTVISVLPARPSKELEVFLSSCDKDVTSDVIYRANLILEAIFRTRSFNDRCVTGTLQKADSMWVEQRKLEALKLYYRVLEAMCRAESHTLRGNNLTSLLSNERFHRCVLACSAELVIATHKAITMMFPTALEKAGITAFDLSKVIEGFVLHEKTLPRELKRHLNSLEERLLESLTWKKGSSMYNSLIIARPALASEINRMGLLAEPMPSLDEIAAHHNIPTRSLPTIQLQKREKSPEQNGEMRSPKRLCMETRSVLERNSFTSPVKDRLQTDSSQKFKLPYMHSAFATPTRPSPVGGGETCAETGINIFFSKIIKLASARIKNLCEKMQLPIEMKEHVYCFVQQILNHRTSLFFERHIDQIILCSFYGVAKISHLPLTFKEIINNYKKQTQCKTEVFRSVFVDWSLVGHNGKTGQELVDIITFYNAVFIPSVKPLLVEIGPAGSTMKSNRNSEDTVDPLGQGPESPRFSRFPSLPDMSPKKVSASHNVYVSPLRSSKMDTYLSPSSTSYYAFLGESTHAYQSPSKDLTAINNRLNCNKRKKLSFDLVSDSQVAGSLCPQNGTSIPSSAAPTTPKTTVKTEQPDCA